jgi:hypothetical protein
MGIKLLDTAARSDRAVIEPGTVILLQGQPAKALILLRSGMAEILDYPTSSSGMPPEDIISGSVRVGLIKGESICDVSGLFKAEPERWSVRAISACEVSVMPVPDEGVLLGIQSKRGMTLRVIRATQQCVENGIFLFTNYKALWRKLASIADSIALADDWAARGGATPPVPGFDRPDRSADSLPEYSQALRSAAGTAGLPPPDSWDQNLFLDRIQTAVGAYAEIDAMNVESWIDNSQYLFLKRLVKQEDAVLLPLLEKDEPSQYYIFQFLSKTLENVLALNRDCAQAIRLLAGRLFGKGGWVEAILALPELKSNPRVANFLHYLWLFATRCQTDMQKLLDVSLAKTYPSLAALGRFHEPVAVAAGPASDEERGPADSRDDEPAEDGAAAPAEPDTPAAVDPALVAAAARKYRGLATSLLEFSELDADFAKDFQSCLTELKRLPDKLSGEKPAPEIRNRFANLYWRLYGICFLKVVHSDFKSPIPGIMLHFGLVDETLVSPEQLALIDQAYGRALAVDSPVPVMTLPYFLEKIFTGEINPSMSEMGESFQDLLRRQEKMTGKEKASANIYADSPEGKVLYEIDIIANPLSRLISGSRTKSLPVLCSDNLTTSPLKLFLEPNALSEFVDSIRKRDYMLFTREVIFKHRLGNDIIRKEIRPNIVIYPCVGSRGMMWQELDGTRKETAARMFIPAFFTDKRDETVIEMLAFLRWEIARAVAGYNWMDPTEGGLSGSYYDYLTYFKKNPDLSTAAKDSLREFIARTRSERDRFAEDYRSWVVYEYEDKVRLNSVARSIFYRFCPFPKEVRERMAKKPMFTELEIKFQNRARKELLTMETRCRRFEKNGESIPDDVQAYIDMLNG